MPTMRTFLPPALRSRLERVDTFCLTLPIAAATQGTGLAPRAHDVTSLPLMETVISATFPRCRRRKRSAARICVLVYFLAPSARAAFGQPLWRRIETGVAPP